jgi:hypothetical protein
MVHIPSPDASAHFRIDELSYEGFSFRMLGRYRCSNVCSDHVDDVLLTAHFNAKFALYQSPAISGKEIRSPYGLDGPDAPPLVRFVTPHDLLSPQYQSLRHHSVYHSDSTALLF